MKRFTLASRPHGIPTAEDFRLEDAAVPEPGDGEFVVRTIYASLDPAMRGWLDDAPSYMPPVPLGDAVRASVVGRVAASRTSDFPEGAWVSGLGAIEEYSLARPGGFMRRIDADAVPSPSNYLSVLGAVGMTAYFGVVDVAHAQARPDVARVRSRRRGRLGWSGRSARSWAAGRSASRAGRPRSSG